MSTWMDGRAPLLYVSDGQVNFLVPVNKLAMDVTISVASNGKNRAGVTVT